MTGSLLAAVLTLKIIPLACFSPCEVRATIYVEGSRNGDVLVVEYDSAEYHSSTINVREGRRTYQLPLEWMSGSGEGYIVATLTRRDGSTWREVQRITLTGGE
jgi:hypothetical protein